MRPSARVDSAQPTAEASIPTDERATLVLAGEINASRAWPRNESPQGGGEAFGNYVIHEQLGVGGMATVHRAERRIGGARQRVALKRLLPHVADDPELVRLFLDEARLVSGLRHRNIAEIYECGRVGDEYFLAMELVAGPTLKQLMRHCWSTVGLIPFPIVVNLLRQLCDGLSYAHAHRDEAGKPLGLVHRDISPSNIVISSNGVVKLIDFGVAKTVRTQTQAGIIKGKLGYIAPEYLEGTLDRRADLWAVGVVAYELLTNHRLFQSDDDLEMMRRIRTAPIEPPSVHNPDVPPELDSIVMTALQRDPAKRWQNAGAMRNALLGIVRPSTNAHVVEWVDWVFTVAQRGLRPVRGTRPPMPAEPPPRINVALPLVAAPTPPGLVAAPPGSAAVPIAVPTLPGTGTPKLPRSVVGNGAELVPLSPQLEPTVPVGAAMLQRRSRVKLLLPLLLILLGGIASAIAVPYLYDLLRG